MGIMGFSSGSVGRMGNVDRMVQAILDKSGRPSEFVKLTDLQFSGCKGCVELCAKPLECRLDDEAMPYYARVKEADAMVLGAPVYFSSPNATMLAFLERFFGFRHVQIAVKDKPVVVVLSARGPREVARDQFLARIAAFELNVIDVVFFESHTYPCYRCGYHKVCTIGGLYRDLGAEAFQVKVTPDLFKVWEDQPEMVEAIDTAAEKLKAV